MAIAILKSFDRGHGLAIFKLDGSRSEFAAHVAGSDRTAMSSVVPGQRICFDVLRDRQGRTFAANVILAGGITGRALRGP
jgi:cold shock CspA family protein